LTPRLVRFTDTAQDHVRREKAWWFDNRTHPEIFATELEHALRILAVLPGAGTPYPQAGVVGLRRLYLRKIDCHIYYTFDEQAVIVRAFWGA
jgi:plasmid stabilization system protein ParE